MRTRGTTKLTFSPRIIIEGPERNTATCYTGVSQEVSATAPELSRKRKQSNTTSPRQSTSKMSTKASQL